MLAAGLTGCGGGDTSKPATQAGEPTIDSGAGAVVTEVSAVAPALESYYRGKTYPQSTDEVVASLGPAGVTLPPGTEVGGYTYDPDTVEFVLCLQDKDGAWASYDTAPMGVQDSGSQGGCPQQ